MSTRSEKNSKELLPHQADLVFSDARYLLNSGGVGSGKTFGTVHRTLKLCIDHPGIFILATGANHPSLRDTLIRDWIEEVPRNWVRVHNKTINLFELVNGSQVLFRAVDDANKLKSYTLGAIAMTEMTEVSEELFKMARTRLRQKNMPGYFYGDTNPGSFESWVYKTFVENPIPGSKVIYSKTDDNDFLPAEYLEDMRSLKDTNPEYYRRMVEGMWGQLEGIIYELPLSQRVTIDDKYERYIAGVDFGFRNPTGVVIIGQSGGKHFVVDELYKYRLTSSGIIDALKLFDTRYNLQSIYCDSSRPEIIADLVEAGLPARPANKSVFDGIMWLKSLIGSKLLYVGRHCTYTLREFDSYIWDQGVSVKEVPLKANDHLMDAIRYAIYSDRNQVTEFDVIGL